MALVDETDSAVLALGQVVGVEGAEGPTAATLRARGSDGAIHALAFGLGTIGAVDELRALAEGRSVAAAVLGIYSACCAQVGDAPAAWVVELEQILQKYARKLPGRVRGDLPGLHDRLERARTRART